MEIRIISLHQPWASLVTMNLKQFETRSWATPYRGKLAIHAAKRPFVSADGSKILDQAARLVWLDALRLAYDGGILTDKSNPPLAHQLPLGCIVAIADLTDCRMMAERYSTISTETYQIIAEQTRLEIAVGDWRPRRFAWRMENIRPIAHPIYYRGRQGLTTIREPMVVQQIEEQLALTDRIEQQLQAIKEAV